MVVTARGARHVHQAFWLVYGVREEKERGGAKRRVGKGREALDDKKPSNAPHQGCFPPLVASRRPAKYRMNLGPGPCCLSPGLFQYLVD